VLLALHDARVYRYAISQDMEFAMPNLPLPSQTDVTIQNQATGAIDYLKYEGSTLVGSRSFDYGIGPDWKVVASEVVAGRPGLVVQSQSTGYLDFLGLDGNGNLTSSVMSKMPVPHVAGLMPNFNALISQLADGRARSPRNQ
jgi:hypothetical protein